MVCFNEVKIVTPKQSRMRGRHCNGTSTKQTSKHVHWKPRKAVWRYIPPSYPGNIAIDSAGKIRGTVLQPRGRSLGFGGPLDPSPFSHPTTCSVHDHCRGEISHVTTSEHENISIISWNGVAVLP